MATTVGQPLDSPALGLRRVPRPLPWPAVAGVVLVVVLAAAYVAGLAPDFDAVATAVSSSLGKWAYAAVAGLAFLETAALVGLAVPGETAVVAAGAAAAGGALDPVLLIALVWLAAAAGDLVSFALGRRLGRPFIERHGARMGLGRDRLARVDGFYERHGGKAVLAGRFVGVLRAVTPLFAGASGLSVRRFVPYSVVGSLAWATLFTLLGYGFASAAGDAGATATRVPAALFLVAAVSVLVTRQIGRARRRRGRTRRDAAPSAHRRRTAHDGARDGSVLVVANGKASGSARIAGLAERIRGELGDRRATVEAVVTRSEAELASALARADGRRVVLVGGDGSLHAAVNAPLAELPEFALIPAGRANNIARALGIPTDTPRAVATAVSAPARPIDVIRVETPARSLFALEALSAGFQAEARGLYTAANSGDTRQGLRALVAAARRFHAYRVEACVDGRPMARDSAAQFFVSNLPFFGFGFEVNPGGRPSDGQLEAILIEAATRTALARRLAAAHGGHHIGRAGVVRRAAHRVELTSALPLVADSTPLGTSTASLTVVAGRLHLATPATGADR